MEYTKDMILHVNYGQTGNRQKSKWNVFGKLVEMMSRHRIMLAIISITLMLIILDFMMIVSFVQVLSSI